MAVALADLHDPDPNARITAIRGVRYRDLKDLAVLDAMARACRDETLVIDGEASSAADPFAAFFDGRETTVGTTVGREAAERLSRAGVPGDPASVAVIARVLAEPGDAGELPAVVARALAETRWHDVDAAVRALVPPLCDRDRPLFEAIVALPSTVTATLAELAAAPVRLRLVQELLNHPPSRPVAVAALERAVCAPDIDPAALSGAIGLLAAWGEPAVGRIAAVHGDRHPWTVAWWAAVDASAGERLAAWLGVTDTPADDPLWAQVSEVLRQREIPDRFPLAAWLTASGADHGLCARYGVAGEGVAEVLQGWVAAEPVDRAWSAAAALAAHGAHAPVLDALDALAVRGGLPDDPGSLRALAAADPAIPGLGGAFVTSVRADPRALGDLCAAAAALPSDARRVVAEAVIALAEAADRRTAPHGKGIVREAPLGVDIEAAAPLVASLGDAGLTVRYDAVAPVIRGA